MDIRKTIVFIGNSEEDRQLFETAAASNKRYSFLALDNEPYSISLLKKSQPFWYHVIFFDLSTPSILGVSFLKQIVAIPQMKHVPVVACIDTYSGSYDCTLREAGVAYCIKKAIEPTNLDSLFNCFEKNELLPYHLYTKGENINAAYFG